MTERFAWWRLSAGVCGAAGAVVTGLALDSWLVAGHVGAAWFVAIGATVFVSNVALLARGNA